jgi:hypothetical protein
VGLATVARRAGTRSTVRVLVVALFLALQVAALWLSMRPGIAHS